MGNRTISFVLGLFVSMNITTALAADIRENDRDNAMVGTLRRCHGTVYLPLLFTENQGKSLKKYLSFNVKFLSLAQANSIYHPAPVLGGEDGYVLVCVERGNLWMIKHILDFLKKKNLLKNK